MDDNLDLEDFMAGVYKDVPEAIKEIFHRMPFGQEVVIGGRKGNLVSVSNQPTDTETGWNFVFDIRFDNGAPDHLEFTVRHTGGGGFV